MAATTTNEDDFIDAQKALKTFGWRAYAVDLDDLAKSPVIAEAGILVRPTDKLAQAYQKFLKCLPQGHEAKIEDGPPRLEVILEALADAENAWKNNKEKTKAGGMTTLFSKVAMNLNRYRELFAIVPSSDKYVSLVAGSISAIIKATVNHAKIAESVSNAIDDLSEDIAYWKELLELSERNMRTEHYIYRLYIVVFEFLTTIMIRWSSKSPMVRMFRSFDSDFFKTQIEDKKAKIRDLEYKLRRQTDLAIQRNTNNILSNEDMAKIIAESQAKFQAEWLITFKRHELRLGQKVKNTLEDELRNQQKEQYESAVRPYLPITGHPASRTPSPVLEDSEISRKYYSVAQIRLDTLRQLGAYTTPQDILTLVQQTQFLNVHNEISHRIQRWNAASTSRTLWIEGPFQAPEPSRYTLLSAHVVSTAQNANLPVLYYFCNSTTTLVDLLYSLLAQLVQALPSDFQSTKDFSSARFEALSQTADSLDRVIILLRDLLDVGPYALYVIVDGLQVLRRSSSSLVQVQGVVNILRSASEDKRSERSRLTKTLFTTDGFTNALNCLEATERLDGVDFWGEECAGPDFDGIEVDFM